MEIDYNEIINKKNIIDIRCSLDYNEKHIKESINVPKMLLLSNPSKYLNKENEFYLLCDKGKVSLPCSKILNALDYKCFSIKNGIDGIKIKDLCVNKNKN